MSVPTTPAASSIFACATSSGLITAPADVNTVSRQVAARLVGRA